MLFLEAKLNTRLSSGIQTTCSPRKREDLHTCNTWRCFWPA